MLQAKQSRNLIAVMCFFCLFFRLFFSPNPQPFKQSNAKWQPHRVRFPNPQPFPGLHCLIVQHLPRGHICLGSGELEDTQARLACVPVQIDGEIGWGGESPLPPTFKRTKRESWGWVTYLCEYPPTNLHLPESAWVWAGVKSGILKNGACGVLVVSVSSYSAGINFIWQGISTVRSSNLRSCPRWSIGNPGWFINP